MQLRFFGGDAQFCKIYETMKFENYFESNSYACGYVAPQVFVVSYRSQGVLCQSMTVDHDGFEDGGFIEI